MINDQNICINEQSQDFSQLALHHWWLCTTTGSAPQGFIFAFEYDKLS